MPLIAETLRYANSFRQQFGLEENSTWDEMADDVLVLRENDVTLEFTTMNGSAVVKQADVVMVTYPLGYTANYTSKNSLNDLDYVSNSFVCKNVPKLTKSSTQPSNPLMAPP
jgi:trehalose/maltose hydrolase-like predicted phosphorylase